MAFLDDDFQSYSIGDHLPLGSWTDAGSFTDVIVAGGPSGATKSLQMDGNALYTRGYLSSFTEFVAIRKLVTGNVVAFANGPNLSGHSFTLLSLKVEPDGTVTATCDASGQTLGNTKDKWFEFYSWNFLQINVTFSDVLDPITMITHVNIDFELALNGVSVLSFNTTTSFDVSQLAAGTSEVNQFFLTSTGAFYANYTLDTLQPIVSYPHPTSPLNCIVHQGVIEVIEEPDDSTVWVHQGVIELLIGLGKAYISES